MPFRDGEIDNIIRDFVCAQCYDDLYKRATKPPERKWLALCPTHGDVEKVGRVTRSWAEWEGQRRAWRYKELTYSTAPSGRSEEEILKELGF